ncbi:hypothetical protein RIF29_20393 [Crotalaria pallida]|uniref:Uncharacterized protein n=1 Tax=Crotalaria pallida TaxID=3830 RepID=A0AAN9I8M7_CROPI
MSVLSVGRDIDEGTRNQPENGDTKTRAVETAMAEFDTMEEEHIEEFDEEEENHDQSFPANSFALELKRDNEGNLMEVQDQYVTMIPNPNFKELLDESLPSKTFCP